MFAGCGKLTNISVGDEISFSDVTNAIGMFSGCFDITGESVKSITDKFNQLTDAENIFRSCWKLDAMPLTFDQISHISIGNGMFYYCTSMDCYLDSVWQNQ